MTVVIRILILIAVSLPFPAHAVQTKRLSMKAPLVAGAPLQVSGTVFGDTTLVVRLVNVSGREIKQVTMGVVLEDLTAAVLPVTRTGIVCDATVSSDGFLVVREANIGFDTAASYFRSNGITEGGATVGVTSVRFGDGSEWSYPLAAKGHFDEQEDQALRDAVRARVKKQFPEDKDMSWLDPNQTGKISTCRK